MIERFEGYLIQIREKGVKRATHDVMSAEDLMTKDPNGIPYIVHFVNEGVSFDEEIERGLGKYPEAVLAYLNNNKYLGNLNITEESLFTEIEGKTILQHMKEKNKLFYIPYDKINNHLEIIDFLIEINELYNFSSLNQNLLDLLFEKDENGVYKIEKYVDNDKVFDRLVQATHNPLIIDVCKKHNKKEFLESLNQNLLMKFNSEGKSYLDVFIEEGIKLNKLNNVPSDEKFVKFLFDKGMYDKLTDVTETIFLMQMDGEKTLLEILIDNGLSDKIKINVSSEETLRILDKCDKLNIINGMYESLYMKPTYEVLPQYERNARPVYQFLLEHNVKTVFSNFSDKSLDVVTFLCKNGYYDLLVSGTKKHYLEEIEDGKLLIDILMDNNVKLDVGWGKSDTAILDRILEVKNYDYLLMFNNESLLQESSDGLTYFEHILNAVLNDEYKFNINQRVSREYNYDLQAKLYILVGKVGLKNHLERLTDKELLKDKGGKTLLARLLGENPEVTVSNLIYPTALTNMTVAFMLEEFGFDTKGYDTPLIEEKGYNEEYLNQNENSLGIGPLISGGDILINKLHSLFMNDGKSSPDLVNALVAGYREALLVNYDITVSELSNLVKIKEDNMDKFIYLTSDKGCYFMPATGSVYCDDKVISTLLHETGHALHHYLTETKIPDDYASTLKSARDNYVNIEAVEEFANMYHEIREKLMNEINVTYEDYFNSYYNDDKRKEIEEFLNKSKEEKIEEYKKLGVSDKTIEVIVGKAFTVDEYIEHQKRVFKEEYLDARLRSEYNIMMVTGDILDAIFGGELHSRELKNASGDKIKGTCGHGIAYYGSYSHGFDEMVANFATLVKSRTAVEDLRYLREMVGEEVFTMISDFYYTNISKSESLDLSEAPSL